MKYLLPSLPLLCLALPAFADPAVVEDVRYSNGRFEVTLSHDDTGWDDYANGWRIELADGTVLGTRALAHPHVTEQPFTRSSSISVPAGVTQVFVRASTNTDGWADATKQFPLQ